MTDFWDKFKKNIVDTLNEAFDKTEELTSIGRIKLEILQLEHRLAEKFTELGKITYKNFVKKSDNLPDGEDLKELLTSIMELEKEVKEKEKELGRIREEEGINFD